MGKNLEMLKTFKKVMFNDLNEINKIIPDIYFKSFYDIDEEYLKEKGINNLILDIDGTILPVDDILVTAKLYHRILLLKRKYFNICLMSNNSKERVLPVAKSLNVNYLYKANKPLSIAFDNALKELNTVKKEEVAMIGDQMLSDIKGANEYGINSILVQPISDNNNIQTLTQRILQKKIEKHLKKKNLFDKDKFYKERGRLK